MLPIAILAGGLATRLLPVTEQIPKSLVPIAGRPFIDWQLELLAKNGYEQIIICLSHLGEKIAKHVGDGSKYDIKVNYSNDGERQLGTGGAIVKALPLLGGQFAVIYGDSYLPINYAEAEKVFLDSGSPALMSIYKNVGKFDKSNIAFKNGQIERYSKNKVDVDMEYIDYGLEYFEASVFDGKQVGQSFDLALLLESLITSKKSAVFEVHKRFFEIGSFQGIKDLEAYLESGAL